MCNITGELAPLATTHGMLVLPGLGKHEGAKSGKLIYFDSGSTPLSLGTPFFRPDGMVKCTDTKACINDAVSPHAATAPWQLHPNNRQTGRGAFDP